MLTIIIALIAAVIAIATIATIVTQNWIAGWRYADHVVSTYGLVIAIAVIEERKDGITSMFYAGAQARLGVR